ncbi:MAG: helix-turn-helix transcriptional regulator [Candidatus Omnitrophota bacterium]|nr:helix-turn-helix transcriptional regulator [Candidatus Omnitrophota bacterium]
MTDQEIGQKIKHYRLRHNLTQEELARKLDIPTITISRWERGMNVSKVYKKVLKTAGLI